MTTSPVMSVTDELIEEFEAKRLAGWRTVDGVDLKMLCSLLSERAELKRDAGRYQWLREQEAEHGVSVVSISKWLSAATCVAVTFVDGSFVDYAIDAAIEQSQC